MPDILPDVMGCPDPTVVLALRRVARQFFGETHIWRAVLDPVTITLGVLNYDLDLPSHSELTKIEGATLNGLSILVTSGQALPSDWHTRYPALGPCIFTEDRKTFNFLPAAVTGDKVVVEVTLKPSNDAAGIESAFFDQYAEILAMGAKAKLMLQPGKTYSNPALGAMLEQRFNDAITDTNIRLWHGFSNAKVQVQPRSFAPTARTKLWL